MQNGDITKPNNPLGIFFENFEIKLIDDSSNAIASSSAKNGFN
jgi:hypothetical protein